MHLVYWDAKKREKQNIYHQIDYLLHTNFNILYCSTTIIQFCEGRNWKLDMFLWYMIVTQFSFFSLLPILLNLRKSEQTFQQCKYNNNILASIQFPIVYTVSKVGKVGILFVSSGLHLNRTTIKTTSIYLSVIYSSLSATCNLCLELK